MNTEHRSLITPLVLFLLSVQTGRADYIAPGDPEELSALWVVGIVWLLVLFTACYGLYRIRRANDLLPRK